MIYWGRLIGKVASRTRKQVTETYRWFQNLDQESKKYDLRWNAFRPMIRWRGRDSMTNPTVPG